MVVLLVPFHMFKRLLFWYFKSYGSCVVSSCKIFMKLHLLSDDNSKGIHIGVHVLDGI